MNDEIVQKAKRLIAKHEGRRNHVYVDTEGHPTIGIGFNLDRPDARQRLAGLGLDYDSVRAGTQDLSNEQTDSLFAADLDQSVAGARQVVSSFDELADEAQIVLIDMVFNLGRIGLSHFKHMIAALEAGDYPTAANEMKNSLWATQVPLRANENIALMQRADNVDGEVGAEPSAVG